MDTQSSQHPLRNGPFVPHRTVFTVLLKISWPRMYGFTSGFSILSHGPSVCPAQASVTQLWWLPLEVWNWDVWILQRFSSFQSCFGYCGSLAFPHSESLCQFRQKSSSQDLDKGCAEPENQAGRWRRLPQRERRMPLHSCRSSVSFTHLSEVSVYESQASLLNVFQSICWMLL